MKILLICLLFISLSFAKSDIYLLPNESNDAKEKIVELIKGSKNSISIAMYNFSYKKFAKALIKAHKRGIKVTVIFDKNKIKEEDSLYDYLKKKGIKCLIANKKMHLKVALFDNKTMLIGSTNFTKKSFGENYEIFLINDNKKNIKKVQSLFDEIINH